MVTQELNITNAQYDPISRGLMRGLLFNSAVKFAPGDLLILREYELAISRHTGRSAAVKVVHVFEGEGLQTNYCLVSLRLLK
jgi:hypothetical protein